MEDTEAYHPTYKIWRLLANHRIQAAAEHARGVIEQTKLDAIAVEAARAEADAEANELEQKKKNASKPSQPAHPPPEQNALKPSQPAHPPPKHIVEKAKSSQVPCPPGHKPSQILKPKAKWKDIEGAHAMPATPKNRPPTPICIEEL